MAEETKEEKKEETKTEQKEQKEQKGGRCHATSCAEKMGSIWWWFLRYCGLFYLDCGRGNRNHYHDHEFWRFY